MTTGPISGAYAARKRRGGALIPLGIVLVVVAVAAAAWEWQAHTRDDPTAQTVYPPQYDRIHSRAMELMEAGEYRSAQVILEAIGDVAPEYPGLDVQIEKCQQAIEGKEELFNRIETNEALFKADRESLRAEIASHKSALAEAREALRQAEANAEEYRSGLNRCVAQLNLQGRTSTTTSSGPPTSDAPRKEWIFVREPAITNLANQQWLIDGTVHNANAVMVEGWVYVDLTCSGRTAGSDRVRMRIPANSVREYRTQFRPLTVSPPCSASAEWSRQ